MLLKLSLPKGKTIWALAHPFSREYIHKVKGIGYQDCQLIVTEKDQPVEVKLDSLPKWAQTMIITSINNKELVNTGDDPSKKEEPLITLDPKPVKEEKEVTRRKPRVNRDG